ncbi:MAG: peptidase [Calditrichaeota bacterium]|nr:peptidase [Calditrichota bacterium]HQU70715.1 peptidase [Calditrichia bacterium]
MRFLTFVIPALFLLNACTQKEPVVLNHLPLDSLKTQIAKFAPVKIGYDDSALSEGDQAALQDLVAAGKIMDEIFLRQVDARNVTLREALNRMNNQEGNVLKAYFDICMGRYDRLEDNQPFINTDQPHPPGANFYPEDMSKDEFEQWIADHPEDEDAFRGTFTVVRRSEEGGLKAIPYSEEYRQLLEQAAFHLREAAQKTTNSSLKIYLTSRAEAFASNDYFQSDMDWMDLADHDIEVVIGPYEVYEDELFNYKAAFEIFLTLVDREDSQRLKKVSQYLDPMERRLPIPDVHKNFNRGKASPIVSVDLVFSGGDTKSGVQTIAFNLPNDERVREAKGSKKVMLKNVSRAKYEQISRRIMERVLVPGDFERTSFEAFFNHVLLHEMVHGLGPGNITVNGEATTVAGSLREQYSVMEEAKADVVGLYQFKYLVDEGVFDKSLADQLFPSFVGGIFRSVRFGGGSAHGGANLITLNYLMEKGGIEFLAGEERFRVNDDKIEAAVRDLAHDLLMLQALGDYEGTKTFLAKYRVESPELMLVLGKLSDIPVDIKPIFEVEQ